MKRICKYHECDTNVINSIAYGQIMLWGKETEIIFDLIPQDSQWHNSLTDTLNNYMCCLFLNLFIFISVFIHLMLWCNYYHNHLPFSLCFVFFFSWGRGGVILSCEISSLRIMHHITKRTFLYVIEARRTDRRVMALFNSAKMWHGGRRCPWRTCADWMMLTIPRDHSDPGSEYKRLELTVAFIHCISEFKHSRIVNSK